ncbi:polysaccharide pyruvyl transferase family protein [Chitinispirillales bacterium ANBcel5]|uniref:polysaccharide pyruvyl transferase family protein n=1 Tax=Cellulosispirillum alkaliphilum TaxID=3039283 RepID=UPI002A52EFD5|nr:polysaccharide pyruvyl transferase family protein [Chitinispirillales bacterium ANBcel5]
MDESKVVRIGISGSYGGNNMGDEAILQSMINQIRKKVKAEIVVFSRDPGDTMNRHKVDRAVAIRTMSRREAEVEVQRLDVFIVGGGGILYDVDVHKYLREAQIAYKKGIPVMVYAVGAGPLKTPAAQQLVKEVLDIAAVVTVRDKPSLRLLEEIGVHREIIVTADPALLLEPEKVQINFLSQSGIGKGRMLFGMSVREPGKAAPDIKEEHYHEIIANAADYMIDRYNAHIVFIPMERKTAVDLHQSYAVITKMVWPQNVSVLDAEYSPGQIMTIIKDLKFVVGMRLHFLIFAALQGVPFVPLPYSGKVMGLLEELHLDTPPLKNITAGRLIAFIDKAWDQRNEILERIENLLPLLQKRSAQNNTLLIELLRILYARRGKSPEQLFSDNNTGQT